MTLKLNHSLIDEIIFVQDAGSRGRIIIEYIALERFFIRAEFGRVDAVERTVEIRLIVQNNSLFEVFRFHGRRFDNLE